jgi:hypothetical protein
LILRKNEVLGVFSDRIEEKIKKIKVRCFSALESMNYEVDKKFMFVYFV